MLPFLLVMQLVAVKEVDMTSAIAEATKRNVWVETEGKIGSGVVVATGFVLTNSHLMEVDSNIKVGKEEAEIVAIDPVHDLMLLKVSTIKVATIRINENISRGQMVFYVANPNKHQDFLSVGFVGHLQPGFIYTNLVAVGGCSGGGLYNTNGELIGLNDAQEYHAIAVHIHASVIKRFLNKYKGLWNGEKKDDQTPSDPEKPLQV